VANNGILANNGDDTYSFTPNENFNGFVTLTYDVTDRITPLTNQTRSFKVTPVNDLPTGSPTSTFSATEDTTLTINASELLAGFSDVDGDTLAISNLVANSGTVINNGNGSYSFTPDRDFNGEVVFTYGVTDGNETLSEQAISFNVAAVNDVPTGSPTATLSDIAEDTSTIIRASDLLAGFSDVEGDALSVVNLVASNGVLVNNTDGTYSFTPGLNFNGLTTITYGVTDGIATLANQTRSFNVTAVNDAPTGSPTATLPNIAEDTSTTIKVSDLLAGFSDVDGDVLTVTNLVASNGALVNNNNGTYRFTPVANFNGAVTLTYDVTDGAAVLTGQTQRFTVTPVNDAPVGSPTAILSNIAEDTSTTIKVSDLLAGFSDVDGDVLTVTNLVASNGALVNNNNGTYSFTPVANFNGAVTLTYDVTDGAAVLAGQTQRFTVTPVNDAPVGSPTAILSNIAEDTSTTIKVSDLLAGFSDVDGDVLTVTNLVASNGALVNNNNGTYNFTPAANFNGAVTLTYSVTDGAAVLTGQTQRFTVTPVNDAPVGSPTAILSNIDEDTSTTIKVSDLLAGFSDVDGDVLTVTNLVASSGALVNNNNGTYNFTPVANFNGAVNLTYDVTDGAAVLTGQTQRFTVTPVNDAPVGSPTAVLLGAKEDTNFIINISDLLAGFSDVDGDTLSVNNLTANNGVLVNNNNGTYSFTPTANFNGAVALTYDVTDGTASLRQTINFNVAAVNDAPTLTGTPANLLAGTEDIVYNIAASDLLAGFTDVDGDTLTIAGLSASNGTLTKTGNNYSFTPNTNFNGVVNLSYSVVDGNGGSTAASRTFNLAPVNDAPIGSPTAILPATPEDTAITISAASLLTGFSDVDGDALSVTNLTASNGTLVNNNNGTYGFTPTANFNGLVNLTYSVTDGQVVLAGQTRSLSVTPVNDAPILQQPIDDQPAGQNRFFTFTIANNTFTDIDAGDTLTLSATLENGNALPNWLSFNATTKTFSGTPPLANNGNLNIKVTATDSAGAQVSDVFALEIGLNLMGTNRVDRLIGSNGHDTISGLGGNDFIDGGRGDDLLDGGAQNDSILGGAGDDTLIGGSGIDTLDGGAGNDVYAVSGANGEFDLFNDTGTSGIDTLLNIANNSLVLNSFSVTNGIESISGNNQAINGNNSNNVLNFSAVSLTNVSFIDGGFGDDSITGSTGGDNLRGGSGNDVLIGGDGNDRLIGGSEQDSLLGGNGSDTLSGGSGIDTLDGGENGDTYEVLGNQAEFDSFQDTGTSGTDILRNTAASALTLNRFTATNGIESIDGNNQAIIGNNSGNFFDFSAVSFTNVSYVDAGNSNDEIVGTASGDNLRGNAGNDTINGGMGDDIINGGNQDDNLQGASGNDTLIGGSGTDTLDGGADSDTYEVSILQAEYDTFSDTGTAGIDTIVNTANSSLTLNGFSSNNGIEVINGNNRAIIGNSNGNILNFRAVMLTNVLFVDGGTGNDSIEGTAFNDNLRGGTGNDTIAGGAGADNLFGGAGNDAFIFNNASEGIDTINDFSLSNDKLHISSAGFGGTAVVGAGGVLTAAKFTIGVAATNVDQRFIYNNLSGALYFDTDGTGSSSQVQIATLVTRPNLNSSGFLII
jgi:Ca2+-binding RTX toxin-like protein